MATTNPTNPTTKPSAKDLLGSLTAGKKPTKQATVSTRPDLELSPALATAFERFAGAGALLKVVEAREEQEKNFLNDGCFQTWSERLWKGKARPANPELKIDKNGQMDIQGIYQVQERYTFNAPAVVTGKTLEGVVIENLVDLFVGNGMSQADATTNATNLVQNELTLSPKPIIDLDRLVNGHYEGEGKNKTFVEATPFEQGIASKLIRKITTRVSDELQAKLTKMCAARTPADLAAVGCFTDDEAAEVAIMMECLTDDESAVAIEYKAQVVVKKGFLQRVCGYVNSLDQLRSVFTIVKPVKFPQAKKFAAADTPDEKNRRLLDVARDILGIDDRDA